MSLSIIVPAFNEADGISYFLADLKAVLGSLSTQYEVLIVNDGSTDETSNEIEKFNWSQVREIQLITNSGHMAALEAGLIASTGEFVITMDADSQHPPTLILEMLDIQKSTGADVVNAIRIRGKENAFLRRQLSTVFYKLLSKITQVKIERDAGDFRLMSRRVVDTLVSLPETTKVFRFLVSSLGFHSEPLYFNAPQRLHGQSKYKISHLVQLAVGSIIGFSTAPLSAIFIGGLFIFFGAIIYIAFLIVNTNAGQVVPGWTSVMVALIGLSAIHIISVGIIGRYVGQILIELRKRPRFITRDIK